MPAPVALFAYNRPWHLEQTVTALSQNLLAHETDLIIFSDGARNEKDQASVKEVRRYIRSIQGFRTITFRESPVNKGLARSVIDGVTEVLNDHDSVVVLEDDMVTSRYFLSYMNEGLLLYANDESVISIHGYMYPVREKLPEYFFLKGAHCWGWATWRRGWKLFERDGAVLLKTLQARALEREFDYEDAYPFTDMLRRQIQGLNDSWAIRWHASAFLKDKLTLYPGISLLKNIGFDDSGTNSVSSDKVYDVAMDERPVILRKISAVENANARKALSRFFKSIKPTLVKRVLNKLHSWLSKNS